MVSRTPSGCNTDNELQISVDRRPDNRPFYTWGDAVSGEVVLRNPNTAYGVEASIRFSGTARTKVGAKGNGSQPSHSVATTLFQFTQHLGVGKKSQQGTDQVWPFEFAFPSGVSSTLQKQRYSGDANFTRNPGHALPPSFRGGSRLNEPENGAITYTLEASITKPYSTHPFPSASAKSEKSLAFCSVRDIENYRPISTPIVKDLALTGHHLGSTEEREDDETLRGQSEHNIRGHSISIHAPHLYFDIRIETPEIACAGAKLPMSIGVEYDKARSTVLTIPTAYLRNVIISLESLSRVRTPAPYLGLGQEPQESWRDITQLADSGPINIPLAERWNVGDLIKNLRIDDTVVPTFKTYNIARTYTLRIEIEAELAQNPLKVKVERILVILPAMSKDPARQQYTRVMPSTAARARLSLGEEPPPAYEQHEGESAVASGVRGGMQRLPSFNTATRFDMHTTTHARNRDATQSGGWGTTGGVVGGIGAGDGGV